MTDQDRIESPGRKDSEIAAARSQNPIVVSPQAASEDDRILAELADANAFKSDWDQRREAKRERLQRIVSAGLAIRQVDLDLQNPRPGLVELIRLLLQLGKTMKDDDWEKAYDEVDTGFGDTPRSRASRLAKLTIKAAIRGDEPRVAQNLNGALLSGELDGSDSWFFLTCLTSLHLTEMFRDQYCDQDELITMGWLIPQGAPEGDCDDSYTATMKAIIHEHQTAQIEQQKQELLRSQCFQALKDDRKPSATMADVPQNPVSNGLPPAQIAVHKESMQRLCVTPNMVRKRLFAGKNMKALKAKWGEPAIPHRGKRPAWFELENIRSTLAIQFPHAKTEHWESLERDAVSKEIPVPKEIAVPKQV